MLRAGLRFFPLAAVAALAFSPALHHSDVSAGAAVALSAMPAAIGQDSVPDSTVRFLTGGTGHRPDSRYDSTSSRTVSSSSVVSIQLIVKTRGGRTFTRRFAGGEIDALFFTMPAIDKFVVPYYTRRFGEEYGARVRHGALRAFGEDTTR